MDGQSVVLCEIADECTGSSVDSDFDFGKKQWRLKAYLAEKAKTVIECIFKCRDARTSKLRFKAVSQSSAGEGLFCATTLVLVYHWFTKCRARAIELEVASKLFPIIFTNYTPSLEFEVAEQQHQRVLQSYVTTKLYDALYNRHQTTFQGMDSSISIPSSFKSTLRQYQECTVKWMLSREQEATELPAYYVVYKSIDGKSEVLKHKYCLHFDAYTGTLPQISVPPGGILADEMGLGKTVELLALVMLNPRRDVSNAYWYNLIDEMQDEIPLKRRCVQDAELCICTKKRKPSVQCSRCHLWQHKHCVRHKDEFNEDSYMCPECWTELAVTDLVESGATIIVSPSAIKMQWFYEISRHISPPPMVLLYTGLHSGSWISPLELAKYDIVLTDYSILRSEIYHTRDYVSDRTMRHQPRFMRPISPLLMVKWWRVCLDEAQMVESNTSQVAEMVRKLPAINRWAVTGTPIQRSIDDLAPLLRFVGFVDGCEPLEAWQTVANSFLLNHNTDALMEILQPCMWRTCKSKVEHELGIPPQTEVVHRLELSNVESLYYREEHFKCSDQFLAAVAKHTRYNPNDNTSRLASISPQLLKLILKPFLRIRQTCSVPVVLNNNVSTTEYLNPQELLSHLKATNEVECKSQLRTWASSYNGMAAIFFIRNNYQMAAKYYKLVLKLAQDYNEEQISVDSVLQIHALHNIIQATNLAPTQEGMKDEELEKYQTHLKKLEWKYLEDNTKVLRSAGGAYETKLEDLERLEQEFSANIIELLATLITESTAFHDALWNRTLDVFIRQNVSTEKLQNVSSMSGIIYIIDTWYQKLLKLKNKLRKEFQDLSSIMSTACGAVEKGDSLSLEVTNFISSISDCHLADILEDNPKMTNEKPKKKRCRLCTIRDQINQFECLLFDKELEKEATVTDGVEKPSVEMTLIKVILMFIRSKTEFHTWQTECSNKLETLNCLQNLSKLQIKYWIEVEYVVKAFDELEMCKMRILLTDNPDEQSNYRVLECQLDELMENNLANVNEAQLNFTRLAGRLKYLKHLKEDTNDKVCPICQTQDDDRYVVLVCGHFICQHCLDKMRMSSKETISKCPICRQESPQIYYAARSAKTKALAGNFSSKIAYIVRKVLSLKADSSEENKAKILIFSQWQSILKHIAQALGQNDVEYRNKCTNRDIEEFKDANRNITCLLMPLSRGSKGLNLIEATHVFLVEPILNPGEELQAIGRVHRFGQTKPTTVHRFIVNGTIEENILSLIASADDNKTLSTHWDLENMTLESLKELFKLKENK
ncbi:E3 ubiquitin-protein ligase SHPRH [Scaptodrosophila lebanonensis]|uniref:E3 ubiquitin-protein ligase SHPRH n=1 Tax=Drosophila lebanonensis TaxID=7225 RepID=A0A6J2UBG1_DROLE|nr:E3 ubiquitin-protein ligase SHPRH [Scaptodrosophila lebanonensis]